MSGMPGGLNPEPDNPRPGDPAAEGASAAHPPHESHFTARHARDGHDRDGGGRTGGRLRNRPLRKKILTPVILAVLGVMLFIAGIGLYHSEGVPVSPLYSTLRLTSTFPVNDIIYAVGQESPSVDVVVVEVDLPAGTLPSAKAPTAYLYLSLPPGIAFRTCPKAPPGSTPICVEAQNIYTRVQPLVFETTRNQFASYGAAFASFLIKAHNFGETFDGINASVAIPTVNYQAPGSATLETEYDVPSAASYNWSSFQPRTATASSAEWNELVANPGLTGRVVTGINYANQGRDDNETFFAGALIGLAGAALLSAVQEALHAND
jgi:hypothetical protein